LMAGVGLRVCCLLPCIDLLHKAIETDD
jgi:hypothetical protein